MSYHAEQNNHNILKSLISQMDTYLNQDLDYVQQEVLQINPAGKHLYTIEKEIPFKLGQNICHNHSALQSSVCEGVVFEQRKQVLALLHGQTSDQLLHNLQKQHKNTDQRTVTREH